LANSNATRKTWRNLDPGAAFPKEFAMPVPSPESLAKVHRTK
jgi:hypothetical protein